MRADSLEMLKKKLGAEQIVTKPPQAEVLQSESKSVAPDLFLVTAPLVGLLAVQSMHSFIVD